MRRSIVRVLKRICEQLRGYSYTFFFAQIDTVISMNNLLLYLQVFLCNLVKVSVVLFSVVNPFRDCVGFIYLLIKRLCMKRPKSSMKKSQKPQKSTKKKSNRPLPAVPEPGKTHLLWLTEVNVCIWSNLFSFCRSRTRT